MIERTGRHRWIVLSLAALLLPGPARAADLIEPWDPGPSNLELWVSEGEGTGGGSMTGVLGLGLGRGWSAGLSVSDDPGDTRRLGAVGMVTRRLGRSADVDVWAEIGVQGTTGEVETRDRHDWLLGTEWSFATSRPVVPYLRLSATDASEGRYHALTGAMLPLAPRLELHLELSTEWPGEGPLPVHLAVGPNVRIRPWLEILPEVSALFHRASGETELVATVGLVLDPRGGR